MSESTNPEFKAKIIKLLIFRIEIDSDGAIIHYYVGKGKIKKESVIDSFFSHPLENSGNLKKISKNFGSRTCNFGAAERT
jgi:hypothetical protein